MAHSTPDVLLSQVADFVAAKMGLYFSRERWTDLERGVESASRDLGFPNVESCIRRLISLPLEKAQIEILASHLTVGETYFFREKNTFSALEEHIIPDLIRSRRQAQRRLRIWTAGCATGEEPYSIAILLRKLIPDLWDWNVAILATDINPSFLQKAAHGVYNEWSFRDTPVWVKERYFKRRQEGRYEILPEIRKMVNFSYLNLAEDGYPSLLSNTNAMDVIFCRNVLMYFASARAKQVIQKFHRSLLDGGWLIVSPSETSHVLYSGFVTANFYGAILYRKDSPKASSGAASGLEELKLSVEQALPFSFAPQPQLETPIAAPPEESTASGAPERNIDEPEHARYGEALDLYVGGRYEEAAHILSSRLIRDPSDCQAMILLARVYANQGKLTVAIEWCEKAVIADKLNPACYMLHATILQEQGDVPEAIRALRRALYLDQNLVLAHFALGNIARQQGKVEEAIKHFENARALLATYSLEQILPESEGVTAGRLIEIIGSMNSIQGSAIGGEQELR
jgi:chemotaxis protein methyltransferase CheR